MPRSFLLVGGCAFAVSIAAMASPSAPAVPGLAPLPVNVSTSVPLNLADFQSLAQSCAPSVDVGTLTALARTESGLNPYAIGVVGGRLARQPQTLDEAMEAVRSLTAEGRNFSLGLGQINIKNLARLGETHETVFQPCRNLRAAAVILGECYQRAKTKVSAETQAALHGALSCYYSGNFITGFRHGYVAKVIGHAQRGAAAAPTVPALRAGPTGAMPTGQGGQGRPGGANWVVVVDAPPTPVNSGGGSTDTDGVVKATMSERASTTAASSFVTIIE